MTQPPPITTTNTTSTSLVAAAVVKSNNVVDSAANLSNSKPSRPHLPWYRSGGMQINIIGMGVNVLIPVILLSRLLPPTLFKIYFLLHVSIFSFNVFFTNKQTTYCRIVMLTYLLSLLLSTHLPTLSSPMALFLGISLAILKVNICMSVCLHRYAAHASSQCGKITHVFLTLLACLANQGGPLWWASHHRCHHKHCDDVKDPHSPLWVGTELAFAFFERKCHWKIVEEFIPRHCHLREEVWMRIIDGWSWIIVSLEFGSCFWYWGEDGLFVAYVAAWICQAITLWFNVVNHPPDQAATVEMETLQNTSGLATSSFDNTNGDKNSIKNPIIKKC